MNGGRIDGYNNELMDVRIDEWMGGT